MQITEINSCRLCNCKELVPVFDFGLQALSTRFPSPNEPDAEILPQGLLLILERKFSWTQGFKTRFRLISLDKFDNREPVTVFTSTSNQFDNLEGLALWKDREGEMRLITVSDDNFHPLQQSEIREFFLKYE